MPNDATGPRANDPLEYEGRGTFYESVPRPGPRPPALLDGFERMMGQIQSAAAAMAVDRQAWSNLNARGLRAEIRRGLRQIHYDSLHFPVFAAEGEDIGSAEVYLRPRVGPGRDFLINTTTGERFVFEPGEEPEDAYHRVVPPECRSWHRKPRRARARPRKRPAKKPSKRPAKKPKPAEK